MATTTKKSFKYVDKTTGKLNVQKVIQGGQFVAKQNLERSQSTGGGAGPQPSATQSEVKYYKEDGLTPVYGAVGESTVVPAGASPAPYANVNLSKATIDVGVKSSSSVSQQGSKGNIFTPLTGAVGPGSSSVATYEANIASQSLYNEKKQVLSPISTPYGVMYKSQVASAQASAERSAKLENDAQMKRNLGPLYPLYPAYQGAESKASGVVGGVKLFGSPLKESLPKISQGLEPEINIAKQGITSSKTLYGSGSSLANFVVLSTERQVVQNVYRPAVENPILFGASSVGFLKLGQVAPKTALGVFGGATAYETAVAPSGMRSSVFVGNLGILGSGVLAGKLSKPSSSNVPTGNISYAGNVFVRKGVVPRTFDEPLSVETLLPTGKKISAPKVTPSSNKYIVQDESPNFLFVSGKGKGFSSVTTQVLPKGVVTTTSVKKGIFNDIVTVTKTDPVTGVQSSRVVRSPKAFEVRDDIVIKSSSSNVEPSLLYGERKTTKVIKQREDIFKEPVDSIERIEKLQKIGVREKEIRFFKQSTISVGKQKVYGGISAFTRVEGRRIAFLKNPKVTKSVSVEYDFDTGSVGAIPTYLNVENPRIKFVNAPVKQPYDVVDLQKQGIVTKVVNPKFTTFQKSTPSTVLIGEVTYRKSFSQKIGGAVGIIGGGISKSRSGLSKYLNIVNYVEATALKKESFDKSISFKVGRFSNKSRVSKSSESSGFRRRSTGEIGELSGEQLKSISQSESVSSMNAQELRVPVRTSKSIGSDSRVVLGERVQSIPRFSGGVRSVLASGTKLFNITSSGIVSNYKSSNSFDNITRSANKSVSSTKPESITRSDINIKSESVVKQVPTSIIRTEVRQKIDITQKTRTETRVGIDTGFHRFPSPNITTTPIIDIPPPPVVGGRFPSGGSGEGFGGGFMRGITQPKSYSPSAFSAVFNIRGKSSKAGVSTGLGIRPIINRRNK